MLRPKGYENKQLTGDEDKWVTSEDMEVLQARKRQEMRLLNPEWPDEEDERSGTNEDIEPL